jgi:hypothetical protein
MYLIPWGNLGVFDEDLAGEVGDDDALALDGHEDFLAATASDDHVGDLLQPDGPATKCLDAGAGLKAPAEASRCPAEVSGVPAATFQ